MLMLRIFLLKYAAPTAVLLERRLCFTRLTAMLKQERVRVLRGAMRLSVQLSVVRGWSVRSGLHGRPGFPLAIMQTFPNLTANVLNIRDISIYPIPIQSYLTICSVYKYAHSAPTFNRFVNGCKFIHCLCFCLYFTLHV